MQCVRVVVGQGTKGAAIGEGEGGLERFGGGVVGVCVTVTVGKLHRHTQDFCLGGGTRLMPPGQCHPGLHQSCTRLKLSWAAGDL